MSARQVQASRAVNHGRYMYRRMHLHGTPLIAQCSRQVGLAAALLFAALHATPMHALCRGRPDAHAESGGAHATTHVPALQKPSCNGELSVAFLKKGAVCRAIRPIRNSICAPEYVWSSLYCAAAQSTRNLYVGSSEPIACFATSVDTPPSNACSGPYAGLHAAGARA